MMSLDDLRRQQQEALQSAAQWESAKRRVEEAFTSTLASLEELVKAKTGLEVWTSRWREHPHFSSSGASFSIGAGEWLVLHFPGLPLKVREVRIDTLDCSLAGDKGGSWRIHVWETVDDQRLELNINCAAPCIPLRVGWSRNLWWCGPQDNEKLVAAIADILLNKDRASEFVLGKPKRKDKSGSMDRGCLVALVILAFVILCGISAGLAYLGAHPR